MNAIKPILFNPEMVRALLDGRKTVTRRVVKPQPEITPIPTFGGSYRVSLNKNLFVKPPYRTSQILYVRETWTVWNGNYEYKADVDDGYGSFCTSCIENICMGGCNDILKWHPSIHMPREAARIFLRVTDVRVEKLQDMTEDDAFAEGYIDRDPWCFHHVYEIIQNLLYLVMHRRVNAHQTRRATILFQNFSGKKYGTAPSSPQTAPSAAGMQIRGYGSSGSSGARSRKESDMDYKDCADPSSPCVIHALPPQARREWVQVKCSTCANRMCSEQYRAVEWLHCGMWLPKLEDMRWTMSSQDGCGG